MPSQNYDALYLQSGFSTATSLGYTGITDLPPDTFDFMSDAIKLQDDNTGSSGYLPGVTALKGGGQFMSTPLQDGRFLTAAANDTVTETVSLLAIGETGARQQALNALLDIIRQCHDYEISNGVVGAITMLVAEFVGSNSSQYSRVRRMEIALAVDFLLPSQTASSGITLTIERDPYWQDIPVGANPKIYTFLNRKLKPTGGAGAPAAGFYNATNLNLSAVAGAAAYQHLIEANLRDFDEAGTANVNYVDIPAASIPGDAPALLFVGHTSSNRQRLLIGRSTGRDANPSTNDNSTNQRMRNTFNGAEATIATSGGVTTSLQNDAVNGQLFSGGGAVRNIMRMVLAAGGATAGSENGGTWARTNYYDRAWRVFLRMRITAGTPANVTIRIEPKFNVTSPTGLTLTRTLAGYVASANWFTFYVGNLNLNTFQQRSFGGEGNIPFTWRFNLVAEKTNDALAATVEIADMVFMPADEPMIQLESLGGIGTVFTSAYVDGTGYMKPNLNGIAPAFTPTGAVAYRALANYGTPITLLPGVANRLYFLNQLAPGNLEPTLTRIVTLNIVPQWQAPRRTVWELS